MKSYTIDLNEKEAIVIIYALKKLDVEKENKERYDSLVKKITEMDL